MAIYASDIINKANSYVGTKESPANSNNVIFNTHYYGKAVSGSSYPWCCVFIWDIFRLCNASSLFYDGKKTAYCPTLENWFKENKRYYSSGQTGDICFMDFGKGRASHVGIVKCKNSDGTYSVIEGNTSTTSNDNGGKVMIRTRSSKYIRGFGRPKYDVKKETTNTTTGGKCKVELSVLKKGSKGNQVKALQTLLKGYGYDIGKSGVDGDFGSSTETAVKKFQKAKKLTQDGSVGPNTWKALLGVN